jgi:hypothetical protein
VPNLIICSSVKVRTDGSWTCKSNHNFVIDNGVQLSAVQDNEPQNFSNSVTVQKSGGWIYFNFYLDVDNDGNSNCSPEMSCYKPDLALDDGITIDLLDANGNYIIKDCPYTWLSGYKCKDTKGVDFFPKFDLKDGMDLKLKYKVNYDKKYTLGKNLPNSKKIAIDPLRYNFGKTEGEIILNSISNYYSLDLGFVKTSATTSVSIDQKPISDINNFATPRSGGQVNINLSLYLIFFITVIYAKVNSKSRTTLFRNIETN